MEEIGLGFIFMFFFMFDSVGDERCPYLKFVNEGCEKSAENFAP